MMEVGVRPDIPQFGLGWQADIDALLAHVEAQKSVHFINDNIESR